MAESDSSLPDPPSGGEGSSSTAGGSSTSIRSEAVGESTEGSSSSSGGPSKTLPDDITVIGMPPADFTIIGKVLPDDVTVIGKADENGSTGSSSSGSAVSPDDVIDVREA